jgi:hypothetical protein
MAGDSRGDEVEIASGSDHRLQSADRRHRDSCRPGIPECISGLRPGIFRIIEKRALLVVRPHHVYNLLDRPRDHPIAGLFANPPRGQLTLPIDAASLTSAILDRILHHADTVVIEGKSFRMKDEIDSCRTGDCSDMVPIGGPAGTFDWLVSAFKSHRAWEEIDRKTQHLYERRCRRRIRHTGTPIPSSQA